MCDIFCNILDLLSSLQMKVEKPTSINFHGHFSIEEENYSSNFHLNSCLGTSTRSIPRFDSSRLLIHKAAHIFSMVQDFKNLEGI